MTYYKRIYKDKAREQHLKEMKSIEYQMKTQTFNQLVYLSLQKKLLKMEKQLKLYDEVMGYKKEL